MNGFKVRGTYFAPAFQCLAEGLFHLGQQTPREPLILPLILSQDKNPICDFAHTTFEPACLEIIDSAPGGGLQPAGRSFSRVPQQEQFRKLRYSRGKVSRLDLRIAQLAQV